MNRNDDDERPPRNTGPVPSSGNLEGEETPGGFDGERVGMSARNGRRGSLTDRTGFYSPAETLSSWSGQAHQAPRIGAR